MALAAATVCRNPALVPAAPGPAWSPLAAALGTSSYGLQTLGELGSALGDVNANGLLPPTPGLIGG